MTGYTGFSGDAAEQEGNFLALHVSGPAGAVITAQTVGEPGIATLDADGVIVIRVTSTAQRIRFTATKNGISSSRTYRLTGLTLASA